MDDREFLEKESITLIGGGGPQKFIIESTIGAGGSSVCYSARKGKEKVRGVLKEFYPLDNKFNLYRTRSKNVYFHESEDPEIKKAYEQQKKKYAKSHSDITSIINREDSRDLRTFIPNFEIYKGIKNETEPDEEGTVYIWTETELKTFEDVCKEIHEKPHVKSNSSMAVILLAIYRLTKCVALLHKHGLIHRDINPSNFGFRWQDKSVLTQTLKLFDVNTICKADNAENDIGTMGFSKVGKDCNEKTDIYSIGATLFYAVVVTDETKNNDYKYNDDLYLNIEELVKHSKLIENYEIDDKYRLVDVLVRILNKSLCLSDKKGYDSCAEMLEDIKHAIGYINPNESIDFLDQDSVEENGKNIDDFKKIFEKAESEDSTLAMQYLLYNYPLYSCIDDSSAAEGEIQNINVAILGFGNYGRKFLDVCLQAGQIINKRLNVKIYSEYKSDWDKYCKARPELANFFTIEDNAPFDPDSYGRISFVEKYSLKDKSIDDSDIKAIVNTEFEQEGPHYVFISLADTTVNKKVAAILSCESEKCNHKCIVSFIYDRPENSGSENIVPLCISQAPEKYKNYKEIERMAFNAHLIWEDGYNNDLDKIKYEFKKPYNHNSCVFNVLSIKYKLHSLGIELGETREDFEKAAADFKQKLRDSKDSIENELICIEHKRWVAEKICDGFERKPVSECIDYKPNDKKNKKHVCIVKSTPERPLEKEPNNLWWDKLDTESDEYKSLDELDRVSVDLHKLYFERYKRDKNEELKYRNKLNDIECCARKNKNVNSIYLEWRACVDDIIKGDEEGSKINIKTYAPLKNSLIEATKALDETDKNNMCNQINILEQTVLNPFIEALKYTDYKKNDVDLVLNIPYILTYNEKTCIIVPFSIEDEKIFDNVKSSLALNPKKVVYLYYVTDHRDIKYIKRNIPKILAFASRKKLRTEFEFVLIHHVNLRRKIENITKDNKFYNALNNNCSKKIKITHLSALNDNDSANTAIKYIEKIERRNRDGIVIFEKNRTYLSGKIEGILPESIRTFVFDSGRRKFVGYPNAASFCTPLSYVNKQPYMTVSDIFSLKANKSENFAKPEFFLQYKVLWAKYIENKSVWKALCADLKEGAEKNDLLCSFSINSSESDERVEINHTLSIKCKESLEKIIDILKENNVIDSDSKCDFYSTTMFKLHISCSKSKKNIFEKLLTKNFELSSPENIEVVVIPDRNIFIKYNSLTAHDVKLGTMRNSKVDKELALLDFLYEKGYIINYNKKVMETEDNKKIYSVSFIYENEQMKDLLTLEGRILEIYTYHTARATGAFDSVESSYEVEWKNEAIKNEFDCVLTKGFTALVVECKATLALKQEFYHKIKALSETLGINCIPVLVSDFDEKKNPYLEQNKLQIERGDEMGVKTLYKEKDINKLGEVLLNIINTNLL